MRSLLIFFSLTLSLCAQTTINGSRTILGRWDASGATSTSPVKTGTLAAIPATCVVGDVYFASDATAGSNLRVCSASNTWTAVSGGGGGSAAPDPSVVATIEEFWNGSNSNVAVGALGWAVIGTISSLAGEASHPGIYRTTTTAAANNSGNFNLIGTSGGRPFPPLNAATNWEQVLIFRTGSTLLDVKYRAGFQGSTTFSEASSGSGVYLEYSHGAGCTSDTNDANWYFVHGVSTATRVSGPAIGADTWYKLRIRSTSPGEIRMALATSGGAYGTEEVYTTNLPTTVQVPFVQVVACSAVTARIDVDYWHWYQTGVTR